MRFIPSSKARVRTSPAGVGLSEKFPESTSKAGVVGNLR